MVQFEDLEQLIWEGLVSLPRLPHTINLPIDGATGGQRTAIRTPWADEED